MDISPILREDHSDTRKSPIETIGLPPNAKPHEYDHAMKLINSG